MSCSLCNRYLDCVIPVVAKPVDPLFIQTHGLDFNEESKPEKASTIIPCPHCSKEDTLHKCSASHVHWNMIFSQYFPLNKLHRKLTYKELYCSEECKRKAWRTYHELLCPGLIQDEQKYDALMALLVAYRENDKFIMCKVHF